MLQTDIHCHLIPGIDDGSRSASETLIMARGLSELGVTQLHLTPHQFRFGNDLTPGCIREQTARVGQLLQQHDVDIEVRPGAEYLYGERLLDALERDEELLTWSTSDEQGRESCLLVELPIRNPVIGVSRLAALLLERGIRPVMAHPERVVMLQRDQHRIEAWRRSGWKFQLDLLSLAGSYGPRASQLAHALLSAGAYDFTGSDLHRPVQLTALEQAHARFQMFIQQEVDA